MDAAKGLLATEYTTQLEFERKGAAAASSSSAVPASNPSCDEASAISNAMAQAAEAAAAVMAMALPAALRRRLQELQTNALSSPFFLAPRATTLVRSPRGASTAPRCSSVCAAPISRLPKLNTLSSASGLPNAALERLRSDAGCIESLMRHAAGSGGAS